MLAALGALADAEGLIDLKPAALRRFRRTGETLWDPNEDKIEIQRLADRAINSGFPAHEEELELSLRSAIVRLGKLASPDQIKVRSYLVRDGQVLSLKVWSGAAALVRGKRERDIRARISGLESYRTPPVLAHGEGGSTAFILEPVIYGSHPTSGGPRLAMTADLAQALSRGYMATMVGDRRLSKVTHPDLPGRLDHVLGGDGYPWPSDVRERAQVRRAVGRLIARDRTLPVAITHGDLVASNVIRDDQGRHHLVDWEHGRSGPAAFDLVKLVLGSGDADAAAEAIEPHMRKIGGRGWRRYRASHQLALGVAQTLSWAPEARVRAVRAGRQDRFDAEHRTRVRWLDRWLTA